MSLKLYSLNFIILMYKKYGYMNAGVTRRCSKGPRGHGPKFFLTSFKIIYLYISKIFKVF